MIRLKTEKDLQILRQSGIILAAVLHRLEKEAQEGVSLLDLDDLARELLKKSGAKPAFLNYKPEGAEKSFPAAICASLNDQVVHGIPDSRVLEKGDILKIDFGVNYKGYFTDAAITVGIGKISGQNEKLIAVTEKSLEEAISVCRPGNHLGDIGYAVEKTADKSSFAVIKSLTGHGVGFELHEDPTIHNYGRRGEGLKIETGMVFAIEPMLSIGSGRIIERNDDSYATEDGSISAHFEHTIAVTENGSEVLTKI